MTAARDYEDMRHLLEHLSPPQVRRLRLIISQDEELSQVADALAEVEPSAQGSEEVPAGLLALIGSVETGRTDVAENHDDYFRERMERRHPRTSTPTSRSARPTPL
ncbi:hypothetical protein ACFQLX_03490 [Streptomyces polyrhachis]|uniref:Uncharacterized protein n=1 Tax=Streptomyces polyrhachis TaxID=1282885 RepID=A0ABW2G905_9ACTN